MATRGFSLGVDFQGGRSYLVSFDKPVETDKVRETLNSTFGVSTEVKTFGSANEVKITTSYLIDNSSEDADKNVQTKLETGLNKIGNHPQILSSEKVGPTIARDLKRSAIWSVIFA